MRNYSNYVTNLDLLQITLLMEKQFYLIDYSELVAHFEGTRYEFQALHNDLFLLMKNEIKQSIQ